MTSRDPLLQSIVVTGPVNPFVLAYMQLCEMSYLDPADIPGQVAALQSPALGIGEWKCTWGPATSADLSNLAFIATWSSAPPNSIPVFAVTVARGTDFGIDDLWGIMMQIWEDLDVTNEVPWPWSSVQGPSVAQGTLDALTVLTELSAGGQTMLDYLTSFLGSPANQNPPLIVTGHSLGGCLTSVLALWLRQALAANHIASPIVPCSFAAPTAGNLAFAKLYNATFPYSIRCRNTLDVAPLAWANLTDVETIYQAQDVYPPDYIFLALLGMEAAMAYEGAIYAQPTSVMALPGAFQPVSQPIWTEEAFYQHHSSTYVTLLGGKPLTAVRPVPAGTAFAPVTRLRLRLGSTANVLRYPPRYR